MKKMVPRGTKAWSQGAVLEGVASHWDAKRCLWQRTENFPRIWRYRRNLVWRGEHDSTNKVDAETQDSTGCFSAWYWSWKWVFSWLNLAKFGFSDIIGIDYSPYAVQLSGSITEKEGLSNIKLKGEYFLNPSIKLSGFYICIDKGTSDALSFNPDNAIEKRKQYVKSLSRVLKVKGFFLITLCDWTKEEWINSVKDLNFSKSFQHPSSALEVGLETVAALVFQKTWDFSLDRFS